MIDTLALATEALNAEGAAAYFDATPEQLAAFLDENHGLWTIGDGWNVPDTDTFDTALAKYLGVLDWFDDLGLIGPVICAAPEQDITDAITAVASAAELVRREAREAHSALDIRGGYIERLTFDLGWPKHRYLWVDVEYASYCPHGEAPFAVDDHDFMDEVDG